MPIIKSAKKRVRVAKKNAIRNNKTKRTVRGSIKTLTSAFSVKKPVSQKDVAKAQSAIDTAVKKGVLSKNKAARKKSQLAKQVKASGYKVKATPTKAPSKPAAKKASPKKASK